jgi:hypothetical protein
MTIICIPRILIASQQQIYIPKQLEIIIKNTKRLFQVSLTKETKLKKN